MLEHNAGFYHVATARVFHGLVVLPLDLLHRGDIEPVIEAAKSLGEHGAA
jgi:hypothetical protein